MQRITTAALLALGCFAFNTAAQPIPGGRDQSFGSNGSVFLDFGEPIPMQVVASARQSDGKLVVGGNADLGYDVNIHCGGMLFARLNLDGTLDTDFGSAGWVRVNGAMQCPNGPTALQAMGVGPYGDIVFAGTENGSFVAGQISFGSAAISNDFSPSTFVASAIAYGPGGFLVAGYDQREPAGALGKVTAFIRLDEYLMRDMSFGSNGILSLPLSTESDEATGLLWDYSSGGWYFAGTARGAGATGMDMVVGRLRQDATIDPSWGTGGLVFADFIGGDDRALTLAADHARPILWIGGSAAVPGDSAARSPALLAIDMATGTFDGIGKQVAGIPPGFDGEFSALLSSWLDFSHVAAGTLVERSTGARQLMLYRYQMTVDQPDWNFGNAGVLLLPDHGNAAGMMGWDWNSSNASFYAVSTPTAAPMGFSLSKLDAYGLDSSYGAGGARNFGYTTWADDDGGAIALQSDGRVVVVGAARDPVAGDVRGVVARLMQDGSRDASMGAGGTAVLAVPSGLLSVRPRAVAMTRDGGIVVASRGTDAVGLEHFAISRLLADGSADPSWNGGASTVFRTGGGAAHEVTAVAVRADGAVIVGGHAARSGSASSSMVLARLDANGALDASFGIAGSVFFDRSPAWPAELANGLYALDDGRLLVAVRASQDGTAPRMAVLRLQPDGSPDPTWGSGGAAFGPAGAAMGVAVQPDGKVVAAGDCEGEAYPRACLMRLLPNGVLDPSFGSAGVTQGDQWSGYAGFIGVAIQPDGKIAAGGDAGESELRIALFRASGVSDLSFFEGTGTARSERGYARGFAMAPDGKFLIAGTDDYTKDIVVARHLGGGDDTPDAFSFPSVGGAPLSMLVVSGPIALTGFDAATPITVVNGEYAFEGCTEWYPDSINATLRPGQTICVRHVSAAQQGGAITTTVRIGDVSGTFTSTTLTVETTLGGGPASPTPATEVSFLFSSNIATGGFECRLDGAAFTACTSPKGYLGLADGAHAFEVRARDAAGNVDPTPARWTWMVDTMAPDTEIVAGPSGNNNRDTATFTFTSTEAGGSFECRLDGAAYLSCASGISFEELPRGLHTFQVRARDTAGNVDATPATRIWRSH